MSRPAPGHEERPLLDAGKDSFYDREWHGICMSRWLLGIAYMLAMGICGIVLVALGSTLEYLAENCKTSSVEIGSVFIARGIGSIFGSIMSAKIYIWGPPRLMMISALLGFALALAWLPLVTSVTTLHVLFLVLGICTAVVDTGCQILTRKLHGAEAGPWLGGNTVAFGLAAAFVPILAYVTDDDAAQFIILVGITVFASVLVFLPPEPRPDLIPPPAMKKSSHNNNKAQTYEIELLLGVMAFFLVGSKVTSTAYLTEYVVETEVIPIYDSSLLILVLWIAISLGRVVGIQDSRFVTTPSLYNHLTLFCLGGAVSVLMVQTFQMSSLALYLGTGFFGFFNGPTVGYCYDLNNRTTVPSEMGMAIVMLGLNTGTSLVPYITSLIWEKAGPYTLNWCLIFSHFIPIPFLYMVKSIHERKLSPKKLES
eukprot:CAMPEP_0113939948 /NCGR_PEP_ID=MMETSP1339-20121228/6157_1 /TAXON_ID=94617 /ORGANISM="Fibrocapsa japonica" /LENGTH=424 /DNA_ID=CAMNT_0000943597 /DNA_START=12 /DNA_END=1286 /DNA_ORIENTATION=+ /assembly_acc=CAM_ASM_000762